MVQMFWRFHRLNQTYQFCGETCFILISSSIAYLYFSYKYTTKLCAVNESFHESYILSRKATDPYLSNSKEAQIRTYKNLGLKKII